MTEAEVRELLRQRVPWKGGGKLAKQLGMTHTAFSRMLTGKRPPSKTILDFLGLQAERSTVVTYEKACNQETGSA